MAICCSLQSSRLQILEFAPRASIEKSSIETEVKSRRKRNFPKRSEMEGVRSYNDGDDESPQPHCRHPNDQSDDRDNKHIRIAVNRF